MSKIALIIYADTETAQAMGRVSNAFIAALEAIEDKDDLKIIFEGAGTKWIPTLENEKHEPVSLKQSGFRPLSDHNNSQRIGCDMAMKQ